ncbi:MAG TPA: Crp/Fnr family transcriptional regulator [Burkholderiales bacterium]|nr:Crp/Fnr family transcriptional regulator [Burkholderiales bacterium]
MHELQPPEKSNALRASTLGLRAVALLADLPASALDAVALRCRWRRCPAGSRVISRDAADNDLYMIVSGRVRVTAFSAGGRQVMYREVGAGDWFGDLAAIDGRTRSADVDALEDTLLAAMGPTVLKELIHAHAGVCDRVLARLTGLVRDLSERVFDFSTLGVQQRVHAELLRLAKEAGVDGNTARIDPAPRHSDIAGKVSTYREQVTRELSVLTRQGLLQRSGRALVVTDVERLQRIVTELRRST